MGWQHSLRPLLVLLLTNYGPKSEHSFVSSTKLNHQTTLSHRDAIVQHLYHHDEQCPQKNCREKRFSSHKFIHQMSSSRYYFLIFILKYTNSSVLNSLFSIVGITHGIQTLQTHPCFSDIHHRIQQSLLNILFHQNDHGRSVKHPTMFISTITFNSWFVSSQSNFTLKEKFYISLSLLFCLSFLLTLFLTISLFFWFYRLWQTKGKLSVETKM